MARKGAELGGKLLVKILLRWGSLRAVPSLLCSPRHRDFTNVPLEGECLHLGSPPLSISGDTDTFCNSDVMLMNLAMEGFRLLFNNNKEVLIPEVFFLFVFFFPRDLIPDNRGGVEAS